jgi:hypothetical protein
MLARASTTERSCCRWTDSGSLDVR